jgi:hypothetical protein
VPLSRRPARPRCYPCADVAAMGAEPGIAETVTHQPTLPKTRFSG